MNHGLSLMKHYHWLSEIIKSMLNAWRTHFENRSYYLRSLGLSKMQKAALRRELRFSVLALNISTL